MSKAPGKTKRRRLKEARGPNWGIDFFIHQEVLANRFIGQSIACEQVAAIMAAYNSRRYVKDPPPAPRVLIVGPPSSGKTEMARFIASELNLPHGIANLGLATPEGYRGVNFGESIKQMVQDAGVGGKDRIESYGGIIILDEICKLQRRGEEWINQIQFATLGLLGGERIPFSNGDLTESSELLDTAGVLVLAMGVFPNINPRNWISHDTACRALKRVGFCDEWIGRFSHVIYLPTLRQKDVIDVVKREAIRIGALFSTNGPVGAPKLSTREIENIGKLVYRHPLGIRHARMHLYRAYFKEAKKLGAGFVVRKKPK